MNTRSLVGLRRWSSAILAILLLAVLSTGCTGRGGGTLPPDGTVFVDKATFGFSFSCEDKSNSTNQNGRLRIQLSYTEHGTNLGLNALSRPFSIHGEADTIDPVLESMICIGEDPPPGGYELIFLGPYWPTGASDDQFPTACRSATIESGTAPCRFEVIVRDNDGNQAPSADDYFSITLSTTTDVTSEFALSTIIYTRAGLLEGGNIEVD